jgi:hypothetical protein
MKTAFLVLCVLLTTAAFCQYGVISSEPQPYRAPTHPQHARVHALAEEQSVVGGTAYTSAQGEKPTWELPQPPLPSLGEIARMLRQEHAKVKKARFVYEN